LRSQARATRVVRPLAGGRRSVQGREEARDEIDRLIRFLDEVENQMELEPEDKGDNESSLSSFDRMTDQDKVWRLRLWDVAETDAEQDDCDSKVVTRTRPSNSRRK